MDKFSELKAAAMAATPGPWEWFTSNSMARLSSIPSSKDGDVLSAFHASDGVPCVSVSQYDMAFIAAANPAVVLAMLAELEAKGDALRAIAFHVSAGGYNADSVDTEVFKQKIIDGIDSISGVLIKRIAELEANLATPVRLPDKNDDEFWFDGVFQVAKFDRAVERAISAAGFKFLGDE